MNEFFSHYLPVNASSHGAQIDHLIILVHWLMLALFVGWGSFFAYTLVRFRKSKNPKADPVGVRNHRNTYLEVTVAVVEAVLLIGISIPLWAVRVDQFPSGKDVLYVDVVAEQFAWNVHYRGIDEKFGKADIKLVNPDNPVGLDRTDPDGKDDILTINQLHLPVNRPVVINISSKDVIHSFALQQMRIKQDAIPGQKIPVWFVPKKTTEQVREEMIVSLKTTGETIPPNYVAAADYNGKDGQAIIKKMDPVDADNLKKISDAGIQEIKIQPLSPTEISCAQLCGLGHYRMKGYLIVETQEAFDAWYKQESTAATSAPAGGSGGGYD